MSTENYFVPKILLCGDKAEFFARIENRPYKIVGQIEFFGEGFNFLQDGKFSIDGKIYNKDELPKILRQEMIDYIVFNEFDNFYRHIWTLHSIGVNMAHCVTAANFKVLPPDNFYDLAADVHLINILKEKKIKTLLDFNAHFAKSPVLAKCLNDFTEIDCICEKEMLPVKENIYSRVYKKFADCCLKHYDAVLIYAKSPLEFDESFFRLKDSADMVIIFVRQNDALLKHLRANAVLFINTESAKSGSGYWLFCYPRKPPETFRIYVATHKKLPAEFVARLPQDYTLVHSGRALAEDLGYIGDNTGDNISHLNPYVSEIDVLYWIWKNTSDTIVGLSHYRRFFTLEWDTDFDATKILTRDQAIEILKSYDIILNPQYHPFSVFENIAFSANSYENAAIARQIITKNLEKFQPDYVDAFNFVMDTRIFYKCNMFVTRRNVFDAYCKWFFSFYLDSVQEILRVIPMNNFEGKKKRLLGFFAEHTLTTYFIKNRLRIKELDILKLPDLKL